MRLRFPKLAWCLGGMYLVYSLVVFFGSLGTESHDWWPIMLYPVIWPLSFVVERLDFLSSDAANAVFYVVFGTIWVWALARLLCLGATRLFPFRDESKLA